MKIVRAHELGGPEKLVLEEVESPKPGPGEIRLKIRAAGVNFADSLILKGQYQVKSKLPVCPGGEVCGEILELGEGVEHLQIGQRAIAFSRTGGFAEECVASADSAQIVVEEMADAEAAGFPVVYGTSHLALWHKARLKPGETLVVHGAAGGVGLTAVEIGKALGARVIATASTSEKLGIAKKHGADEVINSSDEDLRVRIKEMTGGRGADVIYDPVGGEVFDASLRAINFEGRILVIGFAGGTIPQIPANIVMVKNVDILGLNYGNYRTHNPDVLTESFRILMEWYKEGKVKPFVSERFPLEKTADAITHVMERKALGKVVVMP
jgi:NADPH:quinone reductase